MAYFRFSSVLNEAAWHDALGAVSVMQIWPAIDLRGGKCVRLRQGDYERETVFGDDPAAMARRWVEQGATCLHLVDLDGARDGRTPICRRSRRFVAAVSVPCELGGGIRDEATIERLLDLGLSRLVIGTRALKEPDWFRGVCRQFPGQLALGIDAKSGLVATDGWLETSTTQRDRTGPAVRRRAAGGDHLHRHRQRRHAAGPNFAAMAEMNAAVEMRRDRLRRRDDGRRCAAAGGDRRGRLHHRPGAV